MSKRRIKKHANQLSLWADEPRQGFREESPVREVRTLRGRRVHFMGIGGIGMSGIARLLQHEGCIVSGCDASPSEITDALQLDGVSVAIGHSPDHVGEDVDLVIISAAIRDTNPELRAAYAKNIEVVKYAQSLAWLMNRREGVAVSGSHGKTTTSSMIAYTLDHAGRNPSMLIGGLVPQLGGNSRNGGTGPFVVEACEYDRSFLRLTPRAAVITNIDRDHMDCYSSIDELVDAFGRFAANVTPDGIVAVNGDDPNALRAAKRSRARVETFGEGASCNWRVTDWRRHDGLTTFDVEYNGREFGSFELRVPGLYNIRNALACLAMCRFFGLPAQDVRAGLAEFTGTRRRFDRLGEADGVLVFDDYGHHPTEVSLTLNAARQEFPKRRLWCVFQPHQCSRTRLLLDEFGRAFQAADRVIVPDIYSVRDTDLDRQSVHSRDLVREICGNGVNAEYRSEFPQVVDRLLSEVAEGDLVMTMGAGPVNFVAQSLLTELRKREQSHVSS